MTPGQPPVDALGAARFALVPPATLCFARSARDAVRMSTCRDGSVAPTLFPTVVSMGTRIVMKPRHHEATPNRHETRVTLAPLVVEATLLRIGHFYQSMRIAVVNSP